MQKTHKSPPIQRWLLRGIVAPLFLVFFGVSAANVFGASGQSVLQARLTLHVQDMKIKDVLREIEGRCATRFGYQHRLFNLNQKVSLSMDESPLIEVLNTLFNYAVSFEDMGGLVIIKPLKMGGGGGVSLAFR